jgi:hypothetical protein
MRQQRTLMEKMYVEGVSEAYPSVPLLVNHINYPHNTNQTAVLGALELTCKASAAYPCKFTGISQ